MFQVAPFLIILLASIPLQSSSSTVLSRYRNVALGESLEPVVERLRLAISEVKVLNAAPLVQEVRWKPNRSVGGSASANDALTELTLSFHLGRLARIVALYDRERTAGLTDADLQESFAAVYGVPLLRSTSHAAEKVAGATISRQTIDSWADADNDVVLWREDYAGRVGLTITSTAMERALQTAIADGAALEAKNAPQRERDRQAVAAAAARDRDAKIRLENKAKFKP